MEGLTLNRGPALMMREGTRTPEQVARVTQAFLEMKKLDLATLRQIYEAAATTP